MIASGITRKLAKTKTNMKRSQRRKLPVDGHRDQRQRGARHGDVLADAQVTKGKADRR